MDPNQIKIAVGEAVKGAVAPLEARLGELEKFDRTPATQHARGIVGAARTSKGARTQRAVEAARESDRHKGKGVALAAYIRALGRTKLQGGNKSALDVLSDWGYEQFADELRDFETHGKGLVEGTLGSGGALVPPGWTAEIVELLRATAVVRGLMPRNVPMPSGAITMPKQTSAGSASYTGEAVAASLSTQGTGILSLSAKTLVALTAVSNQLIEDSSPAADEFVRDDLVKAMQLREDLAFIRGAGSVYEPRGLRYSAAAGNINAATATGAAPTLSAIDDDVQTLLIGKLEDNDVQLDDSCAFIMAPRTKRYLMRLRDGVGSYVYREELLAGRFMGYRCATTTQVPINLGSGTDESEVYFAKMSDVLLGDTKDLEVEFFPNAAYDDSGTVRAGVSRLESVVRAVARHDIQLRHDVACAVLTAAQWGS